jgi:hypothetical protein
MLFLLGAVRTNAKVKLTSTNPLFGNQEMKMRHAILFFVIVLITACSVAPPLEEATGVRDSPILINNIVERVECELAGAFNEKIREARFQWLESWTVKADLVLTINNNAGISPGVVTTSIFRNAYNFGAGPTAPGGKTIGILPQTFTFGAGVNYSESAQRSETVSFSLALRELAEREQACEALSQQEVIEGFQELGLQAGLGLREWVDSAIYPVAVGSLDAGDHPAPPSAGGAKSPAPATAPAKPTGEGVNETTAACEVLFLKYYPAFKKDFNTADDNKKKASDAILDGSDKSCSVSPQQVAFSKKAFCTYFPSRCNNTDEDELLKEAERALPEKILGEFQFDQSDMEAATNSSKSLVTSIDEKVKSSLVKARQTDTYSAVFEKYDLYHICDPSGGVRVRSELASDPSNVLRVSFVENVCREFSYLIRAQDIAHWENAKANFVSNNLKSLLTTTTVDSAIKLLKDNYNTDQPLVRISDEFSVCPTIKISSEDKCSKPDGENNWERSATHACRIANCVEGDFPACQAQRDELDAACKCKEAIKLQKEHCGEKGYSDECVKQSQGVLSNCPNNLKDVSIDLCKVLPGRVKERNPIIDGLVCDAAAGANINIYTQPANSDEEKKRAALNAKVLNTNVCKRYLSRKNIETACMTLSKIRDSAQPYIKDMSAVKRNVDILSSYLQRLAEPKVPDPPIDSISHQVQFIVTYGANVTPNWSFATLKGPAPGAASLAGVIGTRTHLLTIALGPRSAVSESVEQNRVIQNQTILLTRPPGP